MSAAEEWRPVIGFEGFYEVSNLGRVRSLDRSVSTPGRWGKGETRWYRGRNLRQNKSADQPYWRVTLSKQGALTSRTVHSLVLEAFVGPCPAGQEGRHLSCNADDNALGNLAYGTRARNREDSREAGTLAVGERIAQHKLTEGIVAAIRSSGEQSAVLAARYGVMARHIRRVRNRENWRHV